MWHENGLIIFLAKDNSWVKSGDYVYSAFQVDGKYYASGKSTGAKVSGRPAQLSVIGKAWIDSPEDFPGIKTGFYRDEEIRWISYQNGSEYPLTLVNTYSIGGNICGVATLSMMPMEILDSPYWSLNPIWPSINELKVSIPKENIYIPFPYFFPYNLLTPTQTTGWFTPEVVQGDAKLRVSKYFGSCSIRLSTADVARGFILMKITAQLFVNATSEQVFKIYKIYWK